MTLGLVSLERNRMFKSLVSEDEQKDPNAIPNYLEKVFKQKEDDKLKRKMMGDDAELRDKVKNYASDDTNLQYVDIERFEKKKMDTESYM